MSFQLQQNIRQNAQQLKQYVSDLYDWQQQMEIKQKTKYTEKEINKQKQYEEEFRKNKIKEEKQLLQREQIEGKEKRKNLVRDSNTVQDYYQAWDQYNPDEELKKIQEQEKRDYKPYNPYEDSKNNLRAKPKTKITVKGTRNIISDPTSLKDKGNVHFKVCQYDRAINCYTQCINKILKEEDAQKDNNKKLLALVYSNRAMSYIKINQRTKALSDCNQSIKYDNCYAKTYLRRADCFRKLGRYKQSLSDYKKVKQLSPNEPQADSQIKKIQQFLKQRINQTQQSMIVNEIPGVIPGGYRVEIEEVEEFEIQQNDKLDDFKKVNYLEEL